jgi:hypothetical protein
VRGKVSFKLTYANVMATVAVFIALGGGAYAITTAPKDSVVSRSIKDGRVKTADVADNAVNGTKVANDSLSGADINESSLANVPSATNANHATGADSATSASNAATLDGQDSTHFGVGIMGGVMKDVGISAVASGIQWAPVGASTATATGSFVAPAGGFVARDLEITLASPDAAGETHTFAFQAAGSDLSCTVPENASSCSDTTHAVTVSAGRSYSMIGTAVTNASRPTVDVRFGWRAVSP